MFIKEKIRVMTVKLLKKNIKPPKFQVKISTCNFHFFFLMTTLGVPCNFMSQYYLHKILVIRGQAFK